jgi:hypothetical protein
MWFDDLPLDFTREETRCAERVLITGYPSPIEATQLAQDVGLSPTNLNLAVPVKFLMREILTHARRADRLRALLGEVLADPGQEAIRHQLRQLVSGSEAEITEAAMRRQPSLERLRLLPATAEAWGNDEAQPRPLATPGLERIINAAVGFADVGVFRRWLAEAEVRTARIEIGGRARGTGFLVADALLLTCWPTRSRRP